MKSGIRPLERAFELARSGSVLSVGEIRRKLAREGYSDIEIEGLRIQAQLRTLIRAALHAKGGAKP